MSKSIKMLSIVLIIFSLMISFYSVYASDIDMNLMSDDNTASNESSTDSNVVLDSDGSETQSQTSLDGLTPPSSVGSVVEEGLGITNILSILLITVGVILILLAIAILIKLK